LTIMWSSLRFSPAFVKKWWTSFLKWRDWRL
jgi:hypothetical protein